MLEWEHIFLIAIFVIVVATFVIVLIKRCFYFKRGRYDDDDVVAVVGTPRTRTESLQDGIAKLHQRNNTNSPSLHLWADHPSLLTNAIENGWSRLVS